MKHKSIIIFGIAFLFSTQLIYAGCGACVTHPSKKAHAKHSQSLVTTIGENGEISGDVAASCGMCNFGVKTRGCSLFIQVGESTFLVKGTTINDHGDQHAEDGFCSVVRTATVTGKVIEDIFHAENFELMK